MRFCLLLVAACSTTRTVPRSELDAVANRRVGDGVVLHTTSLWKTRLDPAAHIRFRNRSGQWSDWLSGDKLYVAPDAVYVNATIDVLNYATKIEIRGLAELDREVLALARPAGAEIQIEPDGTAVMLATSKPLQKWVASFFEAMRTVHRPPEGTCSSDQTPTGCPHDIAYRYLRYFLRGKPLGTWTVYLQDQEPIELAGEALYDRMDDGLATRYGWRWRDVDAAEVKSLSGSLTLTAIVGVTALTIALAPVALVARGLPIPGGGLRAAGSHRGGGDVLRVGGGGGDDLPPGAWKPVLADQAGLSVPPLFDGSARRKAIVQVVASAEASVGALGAHPIVDGGAAVLRLGQAFELGGGGLHVVTRAGDGWWQGGVGFVRVGGHLPLDAAHRVAVPLSIDVGGGGGEALGIFTRLNWGVRVALGHDLFVGVTPLSPMLLNWKHDPTRRRGSVMSGLELGVAW